MMQFPQKDMDAFKRVMLAGMKLMYDAKTFEIFKRGMLRDDRPIPQRLAAETAGLMQMLAEKSTPEIPKQIIAPAAAMLLMEMGKFMTESGVANVTGADIQEGTRLLMGALKSMFAGQPQEQPAEQPAGQPAGGLIQQNLDNAQAQPMM